MADEACSTAYFTILARNYLPKALTLAESLRRHHDADLFVLLIDCPTPADLPVLDHVEGVHLLSTEMLGLPARAITTMTMIYDLVEFATAVKPRLFQVMLDEHEAAYYLDPDLYVVSPMEELAPELAASEGGILLTPHFLERPREGAEFDEAHLLYVGFFNLGFCGVDRRSAAFLDWWWARLQRECLFEPLGGLFVDQKWVDIGGPLFRAGILRHYGYNVSVANLAERPVGRDGQCLVTGNGDRLRLFHFHAFDTAHPTELSTRFQASTAHLREQSAALDALCEEYAARVIAHEHALGPAPAYRYWTDSRGRRISRHLRRAYRTSPDPDALPSPFDPTEAEAYDAWRKRQARKSIARGLVGDAVKSVRFALPDESVRLRERFPRLAGRVRSDFVSDEGLWG